MQWPILVVPVVVIAVELVGVVNEAGRAVGEQGIGYAHLVYIGRYDDASGVEWRLIRHLLVELPVGRIYRLLVEQDVGHHDLAWFTGNIRADVSRGKVEQTRLAGEEQRVAMSETNVGVEEQVGEPIALSEGPELWRWSQGESQQGVVGGHPQVAPTVFADGEDAVTGYIVPGVYRDKAVAAGLVEKQPATVRDGPDAMVRVFEACSGIVYRQVAGIGAIEMVAQRGRLVDVALHADDALVVGRHPHAVLGVFHDVAHVAVAHVFFSAFHGQHGAVVVGIGH